MKKRTVLTLSIVAILLLLAACAGNTPAENDAGESPPEAENTTIVIGDIGDDVETIMEGMQPLADYLASQLGDYGINGGQVRVASTSEEMVRLMNTGSVDIYFDSVYPATLISDETGGQIFLRRWRFGVEEYYAVIFTTIESGITTLEELKAGTIAFDQPYSTSGYVLPAVTLLNAGITPVPRLDMVAENQVGFVFSYNDDNTLQWVLSGRVDAGATDDYHFNVAWEGEVREQLVMLAQTDSVPRQVAVARPGIDPALLDAITQVLIHANETETGLAALDSFQTTQFDQFPEGIEAALAEMRVMKELVGGIQLP